jgi:heterodisulfide reductase subunit A
MCSNVCPYHAIKIDTDNGAIVDDIMCRGCGLCAAVCPSGAITIRYYRNEQYADQIDSILEKPNLEPLPDATGSEDSTQ